MGWQGDHEGRSYMWCLLCLKCRGDPRGRPIGINLTECSGSRVGAGVAWMWGWGPCGRPPWLELLHLPLSFCKNPTRTRESRGV